MVEFSFIVCYTNYGDIMNRKKKYKFKKGRIFIALLLLTIIIVFTLNIGNIITVIKLKNLKYTSESISIINKNDIKIDKYSKTLDKIINTNYFILDNTKYYIDIDYKESNNFFENINKLISIGYSAKEINIINNKLDNIDLILNNEYNKNLYNILNSDYFYKDNLERYLKYDKDNIVLNVNMNLDYEFYTHDIEVTTKDSTMLVNKYYKLDKTYIPTLTTLDRAYAVNDKQQVTPETKKVFQKMCDDAKKDNIYIYSGSAYRSYSYQNTLFNNRAKMEGLDYANKTAAKAGYSEHQTGLSMDLMNKNYDYISAEDEEYEWLINNSYKYGFILRFPKDMDNITGYTYEPWHFRYINIEIATYLKENNLTYEEYYGMNLNK